MAFNFSPTANADNFMLGVGYSPISFRQNNFNDYSADGVAFFGSYFLMSHRFEFKGNAYFTVLTTKQSDDLNFRFFFGDIYGGYAFHSDDDYRLSWIVGGYYSSSFSKNSLEGYSNLSGPETGLSLIWYLGSGAAFFLHAKYALLLNSSGGISFANDRAIETGAALKFGTDIPIGFHADAHLINFSLDGAKTKTAVYIVGMSMEI